MSNIKYLKDPALLIRKLRWQALYRGPRHDVTVETENGRLTFDSRDKLIGKHLYMDGGYEVPHIHRSLQLLREHGYLPGDRMGTVIDVGANIGMICIGLLRFGYFERALAFEPTPESYRLLTHNVRQNGFRDQINCLPYALSSRNGEIELELSGYNSGDNRVRESDKPGAFDEDERATVTVSVRTLDELLLGAPAVADPADVELIWMDIQGHEGHFLQGARGVLRSRRIPVVSEFWPYGIARSGVSRDEYVATVGELFSHFFSQQGDVVAKRPIEDIGTLFDRYSQPKEATEIIFVRDE